ncbi:MAG: hypothetical protein HY334_03545 [Armatimonadetes bacterium]|nr:hypothetical protein [Armatimonadota bacterium]
MTAWNRCPVQAALLRCCSCDLLCDGAPRQHAHLVSQVALSRLNLRLLVLWCSDQSRHPEGERKQKEAD